MSEFDDVDVPLDQLALGDPSGSPESPLDAAEPAGRDWFDLADVALAAPRGVVGAVKGAWNLADAVTFDALPDWKKNPLGESTSIAGSLVEGATQFMVGFAPFAGGNLIPLINATRVGGLLSKGSTVAGKLGIAGETALAGVARTAAASGLAGATVFEGHSGRLSDLVEQFPSLSNPITEFLSSKEDDPELLGRLKNAIEQAGLGAFVEGIVLGVKRFGAMAKAKDAGAADDALEAAGEAAVPSGEMELAVRASQGQTPLEIAKANPSLLSTLEARLARGSTPEEVAAFAAKAAEKHPGLEPRTAAFVEGMVERTNFYSRETLEIISRDREFAVVQAERAAAAEKVLPAETRAQLKEAQVKAQIARAGEAPEARFKQLAAEQERLVAAEAAKPPTPDVNFTPQQKGRLPMLRALAMTDDEVAKFNRAFESKKAAAEAVLGPEGTVAINPRELTVPERIQLGLKAADLNMQPFYSTEGANLYSRTVEDLYRAEMHADIKALGRQTWEEQIVAAAKETAAMTGLKSTEAYMSAVTVRAGQTLRSLEEAAPRVISDRTLLIASAEHGHAQIAKLNAILSHEIPGNPDKLILEIMNHLQFNAGQHALVLGQGAQLGRMMNSLKIPLGAAKVPAELMRLADDPIKLAEAVNSAGGREALVKMLNKYKDAYDRGGAEAFQKATKARAGRRFLDMTVEAFMGSVLSSPQTAVVNFFGHTTGAFYLPLERALGSVLIRSSGETVAKKLAIDYALQSPVVRESMAQLTSLKAATAETFRMMSATGFQPENALGAASFTERFARNAAITAENAGLNADSLVGRMVNWVGKAARFPTNVLQTEDTFAKNVIYRSFARARLEREAWDAVGAGKLPRDPAAVASHIEERLLRLTQEGQAYTSQAVIERGVKIAKGEGLTDPEQITKFVTDYYAKNFDPSLAALSKEGVAYSEVATYTNRSQPGTLTNSISKLIQNHPALRLVAPFVNTPANLLKGAAQRVDAIGVTRYIIGRAWPETMPAMKETTNRFLQDMLSGNPLKQAEAVGRIATGSAASVFFLHEALAGNITGGGPKDPNERAALMDTGWLPYSFRVGKSYVSFARLDPFSTLIGTAADLAEAMNRHEDVNDNDAAMAVSGLAVAMANNFTNKSYLTGVANLIGALQAPDKKLPAFFRRQAAAFVPNVLSTAGFGVGDEPVARDVRTLMDAIKAKIPGLSETVAPRRNILGEPLMRPRATEIEGPGAVLVEIWDPVKYSRTKDDLVRSELAALGHAWEPPKRVRNGQDLALLPHGKTNVYDRWQELQGTVTIGGMTLKDALRREIRARDYQRLPQESVDGLESPRVGRITAIVSEYRARAWNDLMKEAPALKDHDTAYANLRRRRRAGIQSNVIPGIP